MIWMEKTAFVKPSMAATILGKGDPHLWVARPALRAFQRIAASGLPYIVACVLVVDRTV